MDVDEVNPDVLVEYELLLVGTELPKLNNSTGPGAFDEVMDVDEVNPDVLVEYELLVGTELS
jgi:hypothetical protein